MIKAEEALKELKELHSDMFDMFETEEPECEEPLASVHNKIEGVITDLEQYLTPTFDEVVKALQDAYPLSGVTELNGIFVRFDEEVVQRIGFFDGYVSILHPIQHISEWEAINLTIRYLEGQKDKENENIK